MDEEIEAEQDPVDVCTKAKKTNARGGSTLLNRFPERGYLWSVASKHQDRVRKLTCDLFERCKGIQRPLHRINSRYHPGDHSVGWDLQLCSDSLPYIFTLSRQYTNRICNRL